MGKMHQYVYIQVRAKLPPDDCPSFSHVFLEAVDDEDAYVKGARLCDVRPDVLADGDLMNDYVIRLER